VLVAGGLGERLGYSGIKLALPAETATGRCFLQLYVECVLALQAKSRAPRPLPIAIMTSDDTHERTRALLNAHNHFGAAPGQITLMKQEKVACLSDSEARLALDPKDPYAIQTKPHGHGDVHALLHATGLAAQWAKAGFEWVCFFQDTNALVFRALPAALGLSVESNFDMNSLAVPRKVRACGARVHVVLAAFF
jgi:UDP-sugar pyrophosphorylase